MFEGVKCTCGSYCQHGHYLNSFIHNKSYIRYKPVYKKYICHDCGKIRYYKEQRLKHNPVKSK